MRRRRRNKKKGEAVVLQDKIWLLCKNIIRSRYPHICYTCGAENLSGCNLHTGHMIPKKVCPPQMKYDLRNLRNQCQKCNLRSEGMGAMFYRHMLNLEGEKYVDKIVTDYLGHKENKLKPKEIIEYYTQLLEEYKKIANE